ncbi:MAG TPA: glutathione transferase GstA [Steroidobacteraceae bacterium]|nr:glutathione transferase GstA [Steroidobacteraceae bacterium]
MLLYYTPGACSLSPHIVLREAGLPFELKRVDIGTRKIDGGGDYLKVNPKGYVPALKLDSGEILTEGPAIVQYLADQRPESGLAPKAGTLERTRLQEWLNFISTEIHKSFSPLFNPAASADWKAGTTQNLTRRFDWLAPQLGSRTHLMGERFTVADAYLFVTLSWSGHVNIDLGKWPQLTSYVARIGARPKVIEALKAEGLLK